MLRTLLTLAPLALMAMMAAATPAPADEPTRPVKVLIITGDTHPAHDWKATTPALVEGPLGARPVRRPRHHHPEQGPDRRQPGPV